MLLEKELLGVAEGLKSYFQDICPGQENAGHIDLRIRHSSYQAILEKAREFSANALRGNVSPETSELLINAQNRISHLANIECELHNLCVSFKQRQLSSSGEAVAMLILEATETAILTLVAVMASKDGYELELLFQVSSEKGSYMEEIRKSYLAIEETISVSERLYILDMSTILERIMSPIARFANALVGLFPKPSSQEAP